MKLQLLLVVGIAVGLVACTKKEEAAPAPMDKPESAAPAVTEVPAVEEEAAAQTDDWRNDAFIEHMHAHAEQLDEINFALDDGDLSAAATPAYWLASHDTVDDLPSEFQPFVYRMREAAAAVEAAEDLESARAGAEKINEQCQACHVATGVDTQ